MASRLPPSFAESYNQDYAQRTGAPAVIPTKSPIVLYPHQYFHRCTLRDILQGIPGKDEKGLNYLRRIYGNPNLQASDLGDEFPEKTQNPFPFVVDTSNMGLGKTYTCGSVMEPLQARFMVIGPASIEFRPWSEFVSKHVLPEYLGFISYNRLVGKDDGFVAWIPYGKGGYRIPLLERYTVDERMGPNGPVKLANPYTDFRTTRHFDEIFGPPQTDEKHQCTIVVFDEFHALKNSHSSRNRAGAAIAARIIQAHPTTARLMYLSGTPFDKENHAPAICRAMGLIDFREINSLHRGSLSTFEPSPELENFIRTCLRPEFRYHKKIMPKPNEDPEKDVVYEILSDFGYPFYDNVTGQTVRKNFNSKTINSFMFRLLTEAILPKISSAMLPLNIPTANYRGFFPIDDHYIDDIREGLELLRDAVTDDSVKSTETRPQFDGRITLGLVAIERGCVHNMVYFVYKQIREAREQGLLWKGVLGLNYIENVMTAINLLRKLSNEDGIYRGSTGSSGDNVIMFAGKDEQGNTTPPIDRTDLVDQFQDNDNVEFMVGTIAAGGVGLSFHDNHRLSSKENGGRKRIVIASPNYNFTLLHQYLARFNRVGSRSVAECYIFYPNVIVPIKNDKGEIEKITSSTLEGIIASLARKSKTTDATLFFASRGLIKYPGDHPRYIQGIIVNGRDEGYINEDLAKIQKTRIENGIEIPETTLVPKRDVSGRKIFKVWFTQPQTQGFVSVNVDESQDEFDRRYDLGGRDINTTIYFINRLNGSILRYFPDDRAYFDVANDTMARDVNVGDLMELKEINRQVDTEEQPILIETPTTTLVNYILERRFDMVPRLSEKPHVEPNWEMVNQLQILEDDIKGEKGNKSDERVMKLAIHPDYILAKTKKDEKNAVMYTGYNPFVGTGPPPTQSQPAVVPPPAQPFGAPPPPAQPFGAPPAQPQPFGAPPPPARPFGAPSPPRPPFVPPPTQPQPEPTFNPGPMGFFQFNQILPK